MREIESQAIAAQQQIGLVRTQLASKQRELRLAQLTRSEISSLPPDTPVYEGVGKMFVSIFSFLVSPFFQISALQLLVLCKPVLRDLSVYHRALRAAWLLTLPPPSPFSFLFLRAIVTSVIIHRICLITDISSLHPGSFLSRLQPCRTS